MVGEVETCPAQLLTELAIAVYYDTKSLSRPTLEKTKSLSRPIFIMFIMVYYTYLTNYKSKTMVEVELYPLLHQTKLLGLTARTGASTPCL